MGFEYVNADEDPSATTEEDGEEKHNSGSISAGENSNVSKRSSMLSTWVYERKEIPEKEKHECLRIIKKDKLEFGEPPFNSEENAKDFFELVFGVNNARTRNLGTLAHRESKKKKKKKHLEPRKYTEEELVDAVICWLKEAFVKDTSHKLHIGISETFVSETEQSLKLHGRDTGFSVAEGLFEERWRLPASLRAHKTKNPLGLLGSAAGLGKTRMQLELSKYLGDYIKSNLDDETDYSWYAPLLVTFNSGNEIMVEEERGKDPRVRKNVFALRAMFHALKVNEQPVCSEFRDFVAMIEQNGFSKQINFRTTVSVIRKVMDERSGIVSTSKRPGILYVGIDEFNLLLRRGVLNMEQRREPLAGVVDDIAQEAKLPDPNVFIYPVLSGTAVQPLQEIFTETRHELRTIPLTLLQEWDINNIMSGFAFDHNWPKGWCRSDLRTFISDYGKHPRTLEKILEALNVVLEDATTGKDVMSSLAVTQKFNDIRAAYHSRLVKNPGHALKVVSHGVANVPVYRDALINASEDKVTYGNMEDQGRILLTSANSRPVVSLSFPMMRNLLQVVQDKNYFDVLHKLISVIRSAHEDVTWQDFEKVVLYYDALREMSLFRCGYRKATLEELYPGARGKARVLERTFKLSRDVVVASCQHQVNGDDEIVVSQNDEAKIVRNDVYKYSLVNCSGAVHDLFHDRPREISHDGDVTVSHRRAGQCKFFRKDKLNMETLKGEIEKVQEAVHNSKFQNEITLIFFATHLEGRLRTCDGEDLPKNCIVLSDRSLYNYLGSAFQFRVFGDIIPSAYGVFINSDGPGLLRRVNGIGDEAIKAIIAQRSLRQFENWQDLKDRVPFIRDEAQEDLIFSKQ